MGFDEWRYFAALVKERVDRRFGKSSEKRLQDFLTPAHPIQPIMNERNAHIIGPDYNTRGREARVFGALAQTVETGSPPGTGGVARSAGVVTHRQSSSTDHPVRSFKGCFAAFSLGRVHSSCSRRGASQRTFGNRPFDGRT